MKNFKRVKEDFVCEKCGLVVSGDGYTDHCPKCLWGKHVDKDIPGDRQSDCRALMEAIETEYQKGGFRIHYKCQGCDHEFWVREGKEDDREKLVKLSVIIRDDVGENKKTNFAQKTGKKTSKERGGKDSSRDFR